MPSPNWTISKTAAPMQLPRSAASRLEVAARVSCCAVVVMSRLLASLVEGMMLMRGRRAPSCQRRGGGEGRWRAAGRAEAQDWQLTVGSGLHGGVVLVGLGPGELAAVPDGFMRRPPRAGG